MKIFRSTLLVLSVIQGIVYATNNQVRGGTLTNNNSAVNLDMDLEQRQLFGRMRMVRAAIREKRFTVTRV